MSSIKAAISSCVSYTKLPTATESTSIPVEAQKSVYVGPPLTTSVIDFSHIDVRMDILSYPNEAAIAHAYHQEKAREAKCYGAPGTTSVVDYARTESYSCDYVKAAIAEDKGVTKDPGKALFETRVPGMKTKSNASSGKPKKSKRVWLLYGQLKTCAWKY